jgi:hypothetical protein
MPAFASYRHRREPATDLRARRAQAQVLEEAARLASEIGVCKGMTRREDGARCTVGLIREAVRRSGARTGDVAVFRALARFLGLQLPGLASYDWSHLLARWNDEAHRTSDDVIAAFHACAASLGERVPA